MHNPQLHIVQGNGHSSSASSPLYSGGNTTDIIAVQWLGSFSLCLFATSFRYLGPGGSIVGAVVCGI